MEGLPFDGVDDKHLFTQFVSLRNVLAGMGKTLGIRASLGQVNAYLAENQSRYDTWKEGGIGRSILHGAAGGLTTGNLGGILAGGGTSLAAPYLDKAAENLGPAGKAAVNALGGAAIG